VNIILAILEMTNDRIDGRLSVHAGTQFSVGVVVYNERSHYRRLLVRNITVDSYVHSSFDFTDHLQSSDLFLTGEWTCSISPFSWIRYSAGFDVKFLGQNGQFN